MCLKGRHLATLLSYFIINTLTMEQAEYTEIDAQHDVDFFNEGLTIEEVQQKEALMAIYL